MDPRKFLFVMWEGGGNVPPQLGLARKLVERGHRVRVLSEPSIEQEVCAIGCEFAPFKKAPHRLDRSPASDFVRDWEAMTPFGAFGRVRDRVLLGPALAYAIDTLNEITCFSPHVLAVDWLLTGAQVAGECAAIPTAALVHAIYMMPEPGKPAPGFGFRPAQGVVGRLRDRTCNRLLLALFDRGMPQLNKARRQMGLPPVASISDQFGRFDRLLVLVSEHFDFPAERRDPRLRFVGPELEEPGWVEQWEPPWEQSSAQPTVVISFSTTFQDQAPAIRRSIQAVAAIRVHALVTLGPALDPAEFAAPAHVFVVRSAPHDRLFADSSVVVTHAGLGTVTRALAHGVPLVCMPMGRDQDDVAARVVEHGAGVRISRRASAKKIRWAIEQVLHDSRFRLGARRLSDAIQADRRAGRGVHELEEMADAVTRRPAQSSEKEP